MQKLKLPPFNYRLQEIDGKQHIFDSLRKKFLVLTPEEWIRQHFVHFLINSKNYPRSLIKCESGLVYNQLQKRTDIIVYKRNGTPFILIECKAATIKINQKAFNQVSIYNQAVESPFICVTNGLKTFVCQINFEKKKSVFIDDLPNF